MSTYQPPGGPPQGPPGYVPPQDPWAVGEHGGLASVPTDPIPQQYEQPQFEQPQFDQPQYPTGADVWGQPTAIHSGQYGPAMVPAQPQRNRAGMLVLIFVAVLLLGGGGVYAGFYFVKNRTTSNPPATPTGLQAVQVNQCLVNAGTADDPNMQVSPCSAPNSFKAIKVVHGDAVPRDDHNVVDPKPAAGQVCAGTKYDNFYAYWDTEAPAQNLLICLAQNPGTATPTTGS